MDIKIQSGTILMLKRLLDRAVPVKTCVAFTPGKPELGEDESKYFKRALPEDAGVPSALLERLVTELCADPATDLHTLLVLRSGKMIFEGEFGAYRLRYPCSMHSMSKSVTAMGVGLAISEGLFTLDSRAIDFFPGRLNPLSYMTHKEITVRSLLTMSSGVVFAESGAITSSDWARDYFESEIRTEPGLKFAYNSMNSYILSEIVRQASGITLGEYLRARLFDPMGITNWAWETAPSGAEKGGWGLYLRPEDMAKLGELYLSGGKWEGSQLIPRDWIRESTVQRMRTPKKYGSFNYGYHVWVARDASCFLFNGMFGQNIFMFPHNDIVVVTTGGDGETFQQGRLYSAITETFAPPLPDSAVKRYCEISAKLDNMVKKVRSVPRGHCDDAIEGGREAFADMLDGTEYEITTSARAIGLLPLITQSIQNNFGSQINGVKFNVERSQDGKTKAVTASFTYDGVEAAIDLTFKAGCDEYEYDSMEFSGEKYKTGASAVFTSDEVENPVLIFYLYFVETSNRRIIKFYPSKIAAGANGVKRFTELRAVFDEVPGSDFMCQTVGSVLGEIPIASVFDLLKPKDDADIVEQTIRRAFSPTAKFKLKTAETPEINIPE
jgi:Beta-lactamase class C and other penicillin binding proteins